MIVNSMDPIGVAVSTSSPPGLSTLRPAPRAQSSSAKAGMFCDDYPSRSRAVMTRVSPASRASSARSKKGRDVRASEIPWST